MSAEPVAVAQVQRIGSYQGIPALGCLLSIEAEKRLKVNDPLYDRATLDAAVAAARAEERRQFPNLLPVIQWLEGGCDPAEAAKELRIYQWAMRPEVPEAAAIRDLKPEVESIEDIGKRALAKVQQRQAEAHAAAMAAAPMGACGSCYGEGQQGGQFSGGFWTCEACQGTGKQAAKEGE